jgi:hypothetical protein
VPVLKTIDVIVPSDGVPVGSWIVAKVHEAPWFVE